MKLKFSSLLLSAALLVISNIRAQNTFPSNGSVGIGTTSPQQRLHVEGTNNQAIFVSTTALGSISGSGMIGYVKALPTGSGQRLGYFLLGSRGGAQNNYNAAGMVGYSAGAWTAGSSRPAYLAFETTPSGSTTRAERMRITESGDVGIGTSNPGYRFVASNNTTIEPTAVIENLRNASPFNDGLVIRAGNNAYDQASYRVAFQRPDSSPIGTIAQTGNYNVAYNTMSDKRLKTNIRETKFSLEDVKKIEVKDYNYVNSKKEQTGFLAQQLYEIYPEAVTVGGENVKERPWMVDYGRVTPLLVKSIQELSDKNDAKEKAILELIAKNDGLKQQINDLAAEMKDLKSLILKVSNVPVASGGGYLKQNVPNPSISSSVISYSLGENSMRGELRVTDLKGRTLRSYQIAKGEGQINIKNGDFPSGVYFYTMYGNNKKIDSKQMVISK